MKYLDLLERDDMYSALKKRFSEKELYELVAYSLKKKIFKISQELEPLAAQRETIVKSGLLKWPFPQEFVDLDNKCNDMYDQIFKLNDLLSEVFFMSSHIGDSRTYEEIKADELAEEEIKKKQKEAENKAFWSKYFDNMSKKFG